MTRWIKDIHEQWLRLDAFGTFEALPRNLIRGMFEDGGGRTTTFFRAEFEEAMGATIPAAPGFEVLEFSDDEVDPTLLRYAVIAWRVLYGVVRPVTLDGVSSSPVLAPQGHVYAPDDTWWPTLERFVASQKPKNPPAGPHP